MPPSFQRFRYLPMQSYCSLFYCALYILATNCGNKRSSLLASASPISPDAQLLEECHQNTTFDVTGSRGAIQCVDLTDAQSWRIAVSANKTIKFTLVEFIAVPCQSCEEKNDECDSIAIYDETINPINQSSHSTLLSRTCSAPPEDGLTISTSTNIAFIRYNPGINFLEPDTNHSRKFILSFEDVETELEETSSPLQQVVTQPSKRSSDAKSVAIGVAVGTGILVLVGIAIGFYCHYYRRKKTTYRRSTMMHPSGDTLDGLSHRHDAIPPASGRKQSSSVSRKNSHAVDDRHTDQEEVLALLQRGGDPASHKLSVASSRQATEDGADVIINDVVFDLPYDHVEILPHQVRYCIDPIGIGSFGEIYQATYTPAPSEDPADKRPVKQLVAVKKMRIANDGFRQALEAELKLLTYIGHHTYIVDLIGAITTPEDEFSLVVGFCELGSLQQYLGNFDKLEQANIVSNSSKTSVISVGDILLMAEQIANGMHFIHQRKCVHRDLAARNILLTGNRVPKISDFGIGRSLNPNSFFMDDGEYPWKWCAIEVLEGNLYEPKSDIWSYGVLMWEMFSLGRKPYTDVMRCNSEFTDSLRNGARLPRPNSATPTTVYTLMLQCWRIIADDRPSFVELERSLLSLRTAYTW